MTAPAYATGPVTLDQPMYACISFEDFARFQRLVINKDMAGATHFIKTEPNCLMLPQGAVVYSDRMMDNSECLRIQGASECFWSSPIVFVRTGQEP
jgi:hypothetical protein